MLLTCLISCILVTFFFVLEKERFTYYAFKPVCINDTSFIVSPDMFCDTQTVGSELVPSTPAVEPFEEAVSGAHAPEQEADFVFKLLPAQAFAECFLFHISCSPLLINNILCIDISLNHISKAF